MECFSLILKFILITSINQSNNNFEKISKYICYYSKKRNIDPLIVLSIIKNESDFKKNIISKTNDYGLMQVNKKFATGNCDLLSIKCNINEGTRLLLMWKKKHPHSWLRRYNWYGYGGKYHIKIYSMAKAYKLKQNKFIVMIKNRKFKKLIKEINEQNYLLGVKK